MIGSQAIEGRAEVVPSDGVAAKVRIGQPGERAPAAGPRRLRIAMLADPELPVPPRHYGGIERVVDMLVRGLVERGHEVVLMAHPASSVPCEAVPYPVPRSAGASAVSSNMRCVWSRVARGGFDVVHSFARLAYLLPLLGSGVPKVMSYQRVITPRSVEWGTRLARGTLHFTGCSRHLIARWLGRPNWHVAHNGVRTETYRPRVRVDDAAPLVFLGRVEWIKGPHLAIEIARLAGRRLIIAGNVPAGTAHREYFETRIRPHVDGDRIRYVGPVDDPRKDEILGGAAALLMPLLWDEPFGIVMVEALACGTPVVAMARGASPEVVDDGVNGYLCRTVEEMASAVSRLDRIDRRACRRTMEERFSDRAVVAQYEEVYRRLRSTAGRKPA